jgi:carboxylate-amine ligase
LDREEIRISPVSSEASNMGLLVQPSPVAPGYGRSGSIDEAFQADGSPRDHWGDLVEALLGADLGALASAVQADAEHDGVLFGAGTQKSVFPIDAVPRLLAREEWALLRAGLEQRARALDCYLEDLYGEQRIVDAGVVPAWLTDAPLLEPDLLGHPGLSRPHVAGFDVVRGADGEMLVLEDNLRTPSGSTYALAARRIADLRLPLVLPAREEMGAELRDLMLGMLRAAAPDDLSDGQVVLLSDGPWNSAWWEHWQLARLLEIPLVLPEQLELRRGRVRALLGGRSEVDVSVVYRRTDESRLRSADGRPTWLAETLLEPLRQGKVACVNGFGTGAADDKLTHAYVEEMVRFYLGEEPLVRSVQTYDPRDPAQRGAMLERVEELVVKPREGFGGEGVIVCAHAQPEDRKRARRLVTSQPQRVVAQETVALSTAPTICGGRLEPRHVDLRAFVFWTADGPQALPGGLTRVARDAGALVVNSSQNGGGKDTWVLA